MASVENVLLCTQDLKINLWIHASMLPLRKNVNVAHDFVEIIFAL